MLTRRTSITDMLARRRTSITEAFNRYKGFTTSGAPRTRKESADSEKLSSSSPSSAPQQRQRKISLSDVIHRRASLSEAFKHLEFTLFQIHFTDWYVLDHLNRNASCWVSPIDKSDQPYGFFGFWLTSVAQFFSTDLSRLD
ncbi:unnamed protein product [Anisakis simplex]|uniref:Uncharacterized protein n=1 Tax=Anisakis simplex TaxID=6269 RepID=A0A0M3JZ94_ANISI|nr:unnamed protein product [Anisakis simplex]